MLVELASTPVAAGLFFLYIKDKYEKEPWKMLFLGVLFGLYTAADRKSTRLNSSHSV